MNNKSAEKTTARIKKFELFVCHYVLPKPTLIFRFDSLRWRSFMTQKKGDTNPLIKVNIALNSKTIYLFAISGVII